MAKSNINFRLPPSSSFLPTTLLKHNHTPALQVYCRTPAEPVFNQSTKGKTTTESHQKHSHGSHTKTKPKSPQPVSHNTRPPLRTSQATLLRHKRTPNQRRPPRTTNMFTPGGAALKAKFYAEAERLVQLHLAAENYRPCPLQEDSELPCPPDMDPEIWRVARNKMRLAERKKSLAALRAYEAEMAAAGLSGSTVDYTKRRAASNSSTMADDGSSMKREKGGKGPRKLSRGGFKARMKRWYQALK